MACEISVNEPVQMLRNIFQKSSWSAVGFFIRNRNTYLTIKIASRSRSPFMGRALRKIELTWQSETGRGPNTEQKKTSC